MLWILIQLSCKIFNTIRYHLAPGFEGLAFFDFDFDLILHEFAQIDKYLDVNLFMFSSSVLDEILNN